MSKHMLFGRNSRVRRYGYNNNSDASIHFETNFLPSTLRNRHCNHQHFTYKHYEKMSRAMKHQWNTNDISMIHPWIINKTSQLQLHPFLLGSKVPSAREVGFLWGLHTGLPGALRVSTGRSSTAGKTQQAIVTWGESWGFPNKPMGLKPTQNDQPLGCGHFGETPLWS